MEFVGDWRGWRSRSAERGHERTVYCCSVLSGHHAPSPRNSLAEVVAADSPEFVAVVVVAVAAHLWDSYVLQSRLVSAVFPHFVELEQKVGPVVVANSESQVARMFLAGRSSAVAVVVVESLPVQSGLPRIQ